MADNNKNEGENKKKELGIGTFYTGLILTMTVLYFCYSFTDNKLFIFICAAVFAVALIYRIIFDAVHHTFPWRRTEEQKKKEEKKRLEKEQERRVRIRMRQRKKAMKQWRKEGKDLDDFIAMENAQREEHRKNKQTK